MLKPDFSDTLDRGHCGCVHLLEYIEIPGTVGLKLYRDTLSLAKRAIRVCCLNDTLVVTIDE
jgi:hypothetical protein